ncbi:MAG: GNAT family N-acetyltransferase [Chloroflexi bacterium]|nr:GNAT family N-acetyltransferase [Chloroflexota bacterium]
MNSTHSTIRHFRLEDIEAVVHMLGAEADFTNQPQWAMDAEGVHSTWLRHHINWQSDIFVAEVGGQLAAYVPMFVTRREGTLQAHVWGPSFYPERGDARLDDALLTRLVEWSVAVGATHIIGRATETDHRQHALYQRHSFVVEREYYDMLRSTLADLPDPVLPSEISVRQYRGDDDLVRLAEIRNATFAEHYSFQPRTVEEWRANLSASEYRAGLIFFAQDGERVVGYCLAALGRSPAAPFEGVIDNVGVRKEYRTKGIGKGLLLTGLRALRERAMTSARLGVDAQNATGAVGLYIRAGFIIRQSASYYRKPLSG